MNKLRDEDGNWYSRYRNKVMNIGEELKRKRAEGQTRYKRKRVQRLPIGYRSQAYSDDERKEEW